MTRTSGNLSPLDNDRNRGTDTIHLATCCCYCCCFEADKRHEGSGGRKKKGATTQLSAIYRNPRCAAESLATFKRGYRRHHSHAATIVSLIFYVLSASGICGGRESRFVWKLSKQEFNVGKMMSEINSFFFLLEDTIYLRDKIFLL